MKNIYRDNKGKFLPGQRPAGRKKGTENRISNNVKAKLQQLLDSYPIEQMNEDLMELEPGERLRIIVSLLDFFMPKLNRVDNSFVNQTDTIIVLPTCLNKLDIQAVKETELIRQTIILPTGYYLNLATNRGKLLQQAIN